MVYGKMEKAIVVVKANVEKIKISNLQLILLNQLILI